jgi:hypothetical protein
MPPGLEYFRSNIVGCAADSFLFLAIIIDFGSQPEISHLDGHAFPQEEISKLQISMDDLLGVQVLQSLEYLDHEEFSLAFGKSSLLFDEIIESLL